MQKSVISHNTKQLISFYRVKDWPHLLGFVLLGAAYSTSHINPYKLILSLIAGALYLGHGYSLNDIFDRQIKNGFSFKRAMAFSVASLLLCLIASGLISKEAFIIALLGHIFGLLYSAPPFRLKNILFMDLIFNSLALSPLFLIGHCAGDSITKNSLLIFFMIFIYFIPIQLIHEMQDHEIDIKFRQRNSFQILGREKTIRVSIFSCIFYALLNTALFKWGALKAGGAFMGMVFALVLTVYLSYNKSLRTKFHNLKLAARYISIIYGTALLAAFYFGL